jgi:large subunit ribosomal protein L30e
MTDNIAEIQKALEANKIILGTDRVIKGLKNGELKKVFVTSNAPQIIKEDVAHYAQLGNTQVVELVETNEDLKERCKKPFFISVVAIPK